MRITGFVFPVFCWMLLVFLGALAGEGIASQGHERIGVVSADTAELSGTYLDDDFGGEICEERMNRGLRFRLSPTPPYPCVGGVLFIIPVQELGLLSKYGGIRHPLVLRL